MTELMHIAAGGALVLAAWLIPRHVAGARPALSATLALDAAPVALGTALLMLATGRPLFAGLVIFALGAGLALVDWTMRETLREPVVFTAMSEFPQVFTHPQLYLPFAGPGLVIGGATGAAATSVALLVFEPAVSAPRPAAALAGLALVGLCWWLIGQEPALGAAAALLRRLRPRGEPFADAAALGPFAMLLAHGVIARAERAGRRAAVPAPALRRGWAGPSGSGPGVPVVLVQCESFFDARRLAALVPRDFLPGFDSCCTGAAMFGRLEVPGWGANTMRAEFAVLTGMAEADLGYDRFNPYHAFARVPIASQVWRLREAGYKTICLHPFDRRFFRRDLAMPALGFDIFLGREAIGGSRVPPYCPDPEFARRILGVLDAEGPRTLIFAVTMGNHGPWLERGGPVDRDLAALFDVAGLPQGGEFLRYLDGLRRSDEMLQILMSGLRRRHREAVLGFYGDHQPSLPRAFGHLGFDQPGSDYAIWPGTGRPARRRDLPAHLLGGLIVDGVLGMSVDRAPFLPAGLAS